MELQFDLTLADHLAWADQWAQSPLMARQMRRGRAVLTALGVVIGLLLTLMAGHWLLRLVGIALGGGLALYWWFAYPNTWRRTIQRQSERTIATSTSALLGPKRYEIGEDGLRFSSNHGGGYLLWSGIDHLEIGPEAIYIYIAANSAHILPRRAFPSEEAFADTWKMLWGRAGARDPRD